MHSDQVLIIRSGAAPEDAAEESVSGAPLIARTICVRSVPAATCRAIPVGAVSLPACRADTESVVGLISDTHGLLRPEALRALQGSKLVVHAGDVGTPEVLEALRQLAPVVAVRGNVDRGAWAEALPMIAIADPAIYVLHDLKELDIDPAAAGFRVVVSGHSHKPLRAERDGVVYINPGAAGPRRFRLPVTVARLDPQSLAVEFVDLADTAR
jgi:hypothetical protein